MRSRSRLLSNTGMAQFAPASTERQRVAEVDAGFAERPRHSGDHAVEDAVVRAGSVVLVHVPQAWTDDGQRRHRDPHAFAGFELSH